MIKLTDPTLHVRWLGKCSYEDVWALQQGLYNGTKNYLLLVEHPAAYTFGIRGKEAHLLKTESELVELGAEVKWVDRGGDITFHGPGQLVGYPILSLAGEKGGLVYSAKYVAELEDLLKEALVELGIENAMSRPKFPGLWFKNPSAPNTFQKIASIGVKLNRGRTMHGFALNVSTDLSWFDHIVPCGIEDISLTSLAEQNIDASVEEVADVVAEIAIKNWSSNSSIAKSTPIHKSKVYRSKTYELEVTLRKPDWLRAPVTYTPTKLKLQKILRQLPTVCEEAGCPNLSECWDQGTATFMINGTRCTRNCGFCLVNTQKPLPLDESEPERVAQAVEDMGLNFVVVTAVARDDLPDGGAQAFLNTISAIRRHSQANGGDVGIEILIPDFKGRPDLLDLVFESQPEVLNHNIETVLRLQSAVRPQAGYARSLSVLARASRAGLTTKSSIMVGLGETMDEVKLALTDLGQVGTDIVTIGQYLCPSKSHLPVKRWWHYEEFEELAELAGELNIGHIEAGPLVRSSYLAGSVHDKILREEAKIS